MKFLTFLVVLLSFLPLLLLAQKADTLNTKLWSASVSHNLTAFSSVFIKEAISPELTLTIKQSSFTIGVPVFVDKGKGGIDWKRYGGEFTYEYQMNKSSRRLDFYVFGHLRYTSLDGQYKRRFYYYADFNQFPYTIDSTYSDNHTLTRSLCILAGYGIRFNINDRFYIQHSIGAGIPIWRRLVEFSVTEAPQYNRIEDDTFIVSKTPAFMMKYGIGFRLSK